MNGNECPCRYCVAPKRYPGCAAHCPDWAEWKAAEDIHNAKIREAKDIDHICFPPQLRKPKKGRKK